MLEHQQMVFIIIVDEQLFFRSPQSSWFERIIDSYCLLHNLLLVKLDKIKKISAYSFYQQNLIKSSSPSRLPYNKSSQSSSFRLSCKQSECLQFLLRYIMQGGIRRGLHIDDDDQVRKPDQYGGIDANRKRGNFEKNLDDMLFGGGAPRRRPARPAEGQSQQKPADSSKPKEQPKPEPQQPKPQAQQPQQPQQPKTEAPQPKADPNKSISDSVNQSIKSQGGASNYPPNKPSPAVTKVPPKQTSILKPSEPAVDKEPTAPGGTIGIISKPKINNYVEEPSKKHAEKPQPEQQQQEITIEAIRGFGNKNKFNKPGYLRKGKKVAENFKFDEENITHHSAVDIVRPFETDRTRQRKLNDFDFHDHEFPATAAALGTANKDKPSAWKKPNQIAKVVNFGKYIDPNDFNPGSLSHPHFLSALSGIAELEANTKRLIEDQQTNSNGFYLIRMFVNSVWRYIAVDNSLPYLDGENAGVISSEGQLDLQGSLIEKAYAKSFGGYDVFSKVTPREYYLRDLTGAPVKRYSIDHPDLQNIVKKALTSGQVVQVVPTERIAALGINPNYSYSVINYSSKGLELRNSWGTLEERSKVNIRAEGNFDLGAGQLRDNISHVLVTNLNTEYYTTTVQSRHRLGFYSTYNFRVRNNTHGFLTVSQWDERLFPSNAGYQYSPATIILQKDNSDGQPEYINANHTINGRNLDLEVNLQPGSYTVFVAVNWKHGDQSFNLTFYGSERVDFFRVYNERDPNHISTGLQSVNVDQGRRTELNKTIAQYLSYHRQSNTVLITVENTSNREGRASIDLTRTKLDSLTLISSHNNEDNYAEKVGYEIDDYKQSALSDRRWGVQLEAGQRFTWVLAAREAYNEGNLRVWGFN